MNASRLVVVLLISAFGLSAPQAGFAQRSGHKKQRFHAGLTFGPEITKLSIKLKDGSTPSADAKIGFHAGLALGFDFGPFTIRSGFDFVNSGALFDGSQLFSRSELNVSFISIPVDFRLRPLGSGLLSPYLFAGPEFRYALNLEDRPLSLTQDVRLVQATFSAGVGVSLRIPKIPFRFSPEVRYVWDMTGIYDGQLETDDGDFVQTATSIKANAVRIGMLLGF